MSVIPWEASKRIDGNKFAPEKWKFPLQPRERLPDPFELCLSCRLLRLSKVLVWVITMCQLTITLLDLGEGRRVFLIV